MKHPCLKGVRRRRGCHEFAFMLMLTSFESSHAWIPSCNGRKPNCFQLAASPADGEKNYKRKPRLEDDIARRLSISKDRAISALSQPDNSTVTSKGGGPRKTKSPVTQAKGNKQPRTPSGRTNSRLKAAGSLLPPSVETTMKSSKRRIIKRSKSAGDSPSRPDSQKGSKKTGRPNRNAQENSGPSPQYSSLLPPPLTDILDDAEGDADDSLASGLASWEDFLEMGSDFSSSKSTVFLPKEANTTSTIGKPTSKGNSESDVEAIQQNLPSIQDLFPPDLSSTAAAVSLSTPESPRPKSQPLLDGVLPVSDLFYRSSQSLSEHDDEELPFSAEQSDAVVSENNTVRIRRNLAQRTPPREQTPSASNRGNTSRRMVRRGMEMLVGGVPINADPPHRSLELFYDPLAEDWAAAISLNTQDFGPLLHTPSIPQVSEMERCLLAERFCHFALKWDICPKDLQQIVAAYTSDTDSTIEVGKSSPNDSGTAQTKRPEEQDLDELGQKTNAMAVQLDDAQKGDRLLPEVNPQTSPTFDDAKTQATQRSDGNDRQKVVMIAAFGFVSGVSRDDLEAGVNGRDERILRDVITKALMTVLDAASVSSKDALIRDCVVAVERLVLTEGDDGFTHVQIDFKLASGPTKLDQMQKRMHQMNKEFWDALNEGDLSLALAAAAREELRWPDAVRARVEEECLFQDDDYDEPVQQASLAVKDSFQNDEVDTDGFQSDERTTDTEDDPIGSASDGMFPDFATTVANSPYRGEIGHILVDAIVAKTKERHPRVIAVGDVHGCIDELQDLLRQCDYRPGDLVVFLGDLVCKGPDSISVVQMAREIGAIGIRGNHDFEVIRWQQAIKSGVDPPVVGSEHFHIASCLSKADMQWLNSLPWYISSKELSTLFVHAGFVSGIRLAKQNPRLMMNMRSILPDGTVTSKFFNNWPWARLWDGPQTVLFGHDADRGLQQYEHAIGLDTGCVYGGRLTALVLPEKKLVSVSARREYFKYRRKHYD